MPFVFKGKQPTVFPEKQKSLKDVDIITFRTISGLFSCNLTNNSKDMRHWSLSWEWIWRIIGRSQSGHHCFDGKTAFFFVHTFNDKISWSLCYKQNVTICIFLRCSQHFRQKRIHFKHMHWHLQGHSQHDPSIFVWPLPYGSLNPHPPVLLRLLFLHPADCCLCSSPCQGEESFQPLWSSWPPDLCHSDSHCLQIQTKNIHWFAELFSPLLNFLTFCTVSCYIYLNIKLVFLCVCVKNQNQNSFFIVLSWLSLLQNPFPMKLGSYVNKNRIQCYADPDCDMCRMWLGIVLPN